MYESSAMRKASGERDNAEREIERACFTWAVLHYISIHDALARVFSDSYLLKEPFRNS